MTRRISYIGTNILCFQSHTNKQFLMWFIHCNLILQYVQIRIRRGAGRASGGKKGFNPSFPCFGKKDGKREGNLSPPLTQFLLSSKLRGNF